MKKVTVLLSTYNGKKFLDEQLESLQAQTDVDLHVLVRDDGSKDATHDILRKWENKMNLSWYAAPNVGSTKSFMELLCKAPESDYYAFCDQDDIWLPEKLKVAVEKLDELPTKRKLYCSNLYLYIKEHKQGLMRPSAINFNKHSSLIRSIATGCTCVFDSELRELIINNMPSNIHMHDLWLFHTAMFFGTVYYDDNSYILYRQHGKNQIGAKRTFISKWKNRLKSIKTISKQHHREEETKEMLRCWGNILSDEDKQIIGSVAHYKKRFSNKLHLIFNKKYQTLFWDKIRIIFGVL